MTNPVREHLRLSFIETKRLVQRKQFLVAVGVAFVLAFNDLFVVTPLGTFEGFYGLVATTHSDRVLNSLIAGVASADALAVDGETGYAGLVLSRNVRRWHYILHKAVAIIAVAVLVSFLRYAFLYAMGAFALPWDVPALLPCENPVPNELGQYICTVRPPPNTLEVAPGPFPALFLTHPLLNDLMKIIIIALGTAIMALLGLLAGACGANAYVAMALPIVLAFSILQVGDIREAAYLLDPTRIVYSGRMLPGEEYRICIWFARWLGWFVFLTGLSMLIAAKRELAAKPESA